MIYLKSINNVMRWFSTPAASNIFVGAGLLGVSSKCDDQGALSEIDSAVLVAASKSPI